MHIESAVVLAAGEGQRLRPLTEYRPKPMLPAANRPILEYVLDALVNAGIDDLHIVVGYRRDRVRNHFGATYRDRSITYHIQETQLGTGHALLQAREALESDFLVVNGDEVLANEMVQAVIDAHTTEAVATLAVTESEAAPEYGAVELTDDRVTTLVEHPEDDAYRLLNAGVYAVGPSIFTEIEGTPQEAGERALTDTLTRLIDRGAHVRGARTAGFRTEATYPWDLLALTGDLLDHGLVDEPERDTGTYVADTAMIHPDVTLQPPVVVGPDTVIEAGAIVGPGTACGRNVTIEAGTICRRSLLDDDTRVGPNATLVEAVIGTDVRIDAGVTVPGGPSTVTIGTTMHEAIDLGGVLADRTRIGGDTTIVPGKLVGPDATVCAGTTVRTNVSADVEVR